MYDNVNIKFEDAEGIITRMNAWWYVFKLERKIKKYGITAQDCAFLAHAYDYCPYCTKKNTYKAFKYALKSIKLDKNYAYGYYVAADILVGQNKYEKGLKYLEKAKKLYGKSFVKYYEIVLLQIMAYMGLCMHKELYLSVKKYFKYKSDNPEYYIGKFIINAHPCMESKLDIESIKMFFVKSFKLKIFPDLIIIKLFFLMSTWVLYSIFHPVSVLHLKLGMYSALGRDDAALKMYKKLAKKYKFLKTIIYAQLLYHYYSEDEYEKCIACANKFLIEDKQKIFYVYKAMSYGYLGNIKQALKNFDLARSNKKNSGFLVKILDKILFDNFLFRHETSFNYWISKFYYKEEHYEKALQYINKELIICKNFDNYKLKGMIYSRLEKYKESNINFNKAIRCEEDNSNIWNVYGWMAWNYYLLKDYNSALVYSSFSIKEHPTAENYEIRGDIYWAKGEGKKANECYAKAKKCYD